MEVAFCHPCSDQGLRSRTMPTPAMPEDTGLQAMQVGSAVLYVSYLYLWEAARFSCSQDRVPALSPSLALRRLDGYMR